MMLLVGIVMVSGCIDTQSISYKIESYGKIIDFEVIGTSGWFTHESYKIITNETTIYVSYYLHDLEVGKCLIKKQPEGVFMIQECEVKP